MNAIDCPDIESLRFEGVTFKHERQDAVLSNCDFNFPTEGVVWLKSEEGAGKSTLMQLMAGLLMPQAGRYEINGESVSEMSFEEFLPYRLRIGYTFDYGGLISNRTLFDNLLLPLVYHKLLPDEVARERVAEWIARFDLQKFAKERPAHVPGRIRKLAILLRGLITAPQVLLMDDPSVGLGEATLESFMVLLKEMREQGHLRHLYISSYDDNFMAQLPCEIVHLSAGQLYYQPLERQTVVAA